MKYTDEWFCHCNICEGGDYYDQTERDDFQENMFEEDDYYDLAAQEDEWSVAEAAAQEAYDRAVYEGGEW